MTSDQTGAKISIEDFLAMLPEGAGKLNEKMGVELVEISAERVVATMPVAGNTQPYGLLHGGASVVLAETLGSIGSGIRPSGQRSSVTFATPAKSPDFVHVASPGFFNSRP